MLSSSSQRTHDVAIARPSWSLEWATPAALCRMTLWGFLALLVSRTTADADLWGHLRFGLDMLAARAIHVSDIYSFTSDRTWVNHEWLSEVSMGVAYTTLGPAGLVLLKLAVILTIAGIAWRVASEEGAAPIAREIFVILAVFSTFSRTQVVRPQMFSVAIFCLVLYLLRRADRGQPKALWGIPLCFAVWVNFHGGWFVGLAAVGLWMLGDAWQHRTAPRLRLLAGVGALSVLATLVNPYGTGLWQFLAETVRSARPDISDWKPLLQLPKGILIIEAVLPLVAAAAIWRASRRGTPRNGVGERPAREDAAAGASRNADARFGIAVRDAAVIALLTAATFRIGRVDAFMQSAIAIFLAGPLVALLNGIDRRVGGSLMRASLPVGAMAVALAAYIGAGVIGNAQVVRVEGPWIPDREAAMLLRDARPGARVLTWFDWGEYAIWQLSPAGITVSMDGRRETVYSDRVIQDHVRFYEGRPEMADYPDRIGADHIWVPSRFPIVPALVERGWTRVLDTGTSVVLSRRGDPIVRRPIDAGPDVFPWP